MFWIFRFLQSHGCVRIRALRRLRRTHLHTAHVMLHTRHVVHVVLLPGLLRVGILRRLALCLVLMLHICLWTARHGHTLHAVRGVVWFRGGAGTLSECSQAESARNHKCKSRDFHLFSSH